MEDFEKTQRWVRRAIVCIFILVVLMLAAMGATVIYTMTHDPAAMMGDFINQVVKHATKS